MSAYGIDKINLLQIDVEGFDYEVIKIFDISKSKPGMIVFESSHLSETDYRSCLNLLAENGYSTKKMGRNTAAMWQPGEVFTSFFE